MENVSGSAADAHQQPTTTNFTRREFVAAVGVKNVVVVETEDAILITTREHSQDVGKVVKHLAEKKLTKLI